MRGKWRIERVLGVGGMAAVYAAVHHNNNRVAIKMLHPGVAIDHDIAARFLREGYVANTVDHPGAVRVYDNDVTEDDVAFLVMELIEGESLEGRAARLGPTLPLPEVLEIADQLLDVLTAAHGKDIIHRDLKPDNLMLTTEGRLKVLDFGIARLREMSGQQGRVTAAGSFMGTPAFMAPEQARGRWSEVDSRSDLWAVGATMFVLLTGRNVHEAETVNDQLVLAATTPAPPLLQLRPELPPAVGHIVDRALAFKKEERWPTARAMRAALGELAAEVPFASGLSVPRISISLDNADREADTIAAPAEVVSQITGSSRPESGTTAAAVTSSRSASVPPRVSRRLLGGVVAAAALVLLLAILGLGRRSSEIPGAAREPSTAHPEPARAPAAAPAPLPEPKPAPAPSPEVTPADSAPVASAKPRTAPRPRVQSRTHHAKPTASKAAAKPAPPHTPATSDLFNSRY